MKSHLKWLFRPFWRCFLQILPAKMHIVLVYWRQFGRIPNLADPKTFNEKILHRMLYDRDPRMPSLVDKIAAKEAMAARFGNGFIIPTLATLEDERDVDFSNLPYPCVIKAAHSSGMNMFLSKRPEDEGEARCQLRRYLSYDHSSLYEEWAYSKVPHRLLVEPFIDGGEHGLVDYKFHTCGGRVYAIQVDLDRHTVHRRCVFDRSWSRMPVEMTFPLYSGTIPPPGTLADMINYAELIGKEFSYLRVDLYEIAGVVKFGEVTFYPGAGVIETFDPPEFNEAFGAAWQVQ